MLQTTELNFSSINLKSVRNFQRRFAKSLKYFDHTIVLNMETGSRIGLFCPGKFPGMFGTKSYLFKKTTRNS